jgi:uracil-DNA glycosylase family 4
MNTRRKLKLIPPQHAPRETRESLSIVERAVAGCTSCSLHENRTHSVFGAGHPSATLMFVGEAPGPDEDGMGEPFVGVSGRLLDKIIGAMGCDRTEVFLANTVSCRLDDGRQLNRTQIDACRGHLEAQIEIVQPQVIVPLGATAWSWFKHGDKRKMADIRGTVYRWRKIILIPTYHPAFLLRKPDFKGDVWADMQTVMTLLTSETRQREFEIEEIDERGRDAGGNLTEPSLFD